jgi:hypothetical protein
MKHLFIIISDAINKQISLLFIASEEKFLHQIHIEEQFGSVGANPAKAKEEEKKKLAEKKAAIGYVYEDSTPQNFAGRNFGTNENESEEEEEEDDEEDIDFGTYTNDNI